MYILTDNNENNVNAIMYISKTLNRQEETNYYLINDNMVAIPPQFVKAVYEVNTIPEKVEEQKYCYTKEDGFYKNQNYKRYYSNEERIQMLEEIMNELILGGE